MTRGAAAILCATLAWLAFTARRRCGSARWRTRSARSLRRTSTTSPALNLRGDGFMRDFGEEILFGMHFHDGETGASLHNTYPVLYARATREEVTRFQRAHPARCRTSSAAVPVRCASRLGRVG